MIHEQTTQGLVNSASVLIQTISAEFESTATHETALRLNGAVQTWLLAKILLFLETERHEREESIRKYREA